MKLDEIQLLELLDYIQMLDEQVGLRAETVLDIEKIIGRELDRQKKEEKAKNNQPFNPQH